MNTFKALNLPVNNIAKLAKMALSYLESLKQPLPEDNTKEGKKWYKENERQYQALNYINTVLGLGSTKKELQELTNKPTLESNIKTFKNSYIKSSKNFTKSELAFEQGKSYQRYHDLACLHENKVSEANLIITTLYPLTKTIFDNLTDKKVIDCSIIDALADTQQEQETNELIEKFINFFS